VTAVCSTGNVELVRSIGADRVVDYTREDVSHDGRRYDAILQVAGTDSPWRLRRLLAPGGSLVLSSGQGRLAGIDRILAAGLLSAVVRRRMVAFVEKENLADLEALSELVEAGKVRPVIDRAYPLSEARAAVRYVEGGHTRGKVVVTVEGDGDGRARERTRTPDVQARRRNASRTPSQLL
jgi:NADPH:quinone reductase-like Zn-dependent oxidoreductase